MDEVDIIHGQSNQGELQKISVLFARRARSYCLDLLKDHTADTSSIKQMYRAATSVGANIREAKYAESRRDFQHKLKVAEKEMGEFYYWLGLLASDPSIVFHRDCPELLQMAQSVLKLLAAISRSLKQ
jgi:four helix bundle protein